MGFGTPLGNVLSLPFLTWKQHSRLLISISAVYLAFLSSWPHVFSGKPVEVSESLLFSHNLKKQIGIPLPGARNREGGDKRAYKAMSTFGVGYFRFWTMIHSRKCHMCVVTFRRSWSQDSTFRWVKTSRRARTG